MKLSSLPHAYKHFNRLREIASVLIKYGLADWIDRLDLEFAKDLLRDSGSEALARQKRETRIRLALSELGPTFIKLGQVLSTRADLVGVDLANELQLLQTEVRADPPHVVKAMIERELAHSLEDVFSEFDERPVASASVGQVHLARLKGGERVAVKVQHRGIEEKVRIDLEILTAMAQLAERRTDLQPYRPRATVVEFQREMKHELDFTREERSMQQFAKDFRDDARVHIPFPYARYCTSRVLTMEYLDGIKLLQRQRLEAAGMDLDEIAKRGAELYLTMIFGNGVYHADPHPGNIVILPGNVIGLLDFGMTGRIDEGLREDIGEMLMAITASDAAYLTKLITRMGAVPPELDHAALAVDVADFVAHYAHQPLAEFDLGVALNELVEMIRRYRIMLPARVAMLIKVLVMLEGTSRLLSPRFCLMEVMRPFQQKVMWKRLSPARRLKKLRRFASELEHLADVLPRGIIDILQQVQTGKFDIHLDHRGLEPSVNRLVLGMLASALFLGSSLLITRDVPPFIPWPWFVAEARLSVLGSLGAAVSIFLGLRLLRAINKSGHLDRR